MSIKRWAVMYGAFLGLNLWAGPVIDLNLLVNETSSGREGTECAKLRTLLASPQDPDGSKGFEEFAKYAERYQQMQTSGKLDTRALSNLYREKKSFKDGTGPAAQAFKLFAKASFDEFLTQRPHTYQVEDTLAELSSSLYSGERSGTGYFSDEVSRGQKYLLKNAENAEDFVKYIWRTRNLSEWSNLLPKEKLARIDAEAEYLLSARHHFRYSDHFREALRKFEEKDPKGVNAIDSNDLLMRMTEKAGEALSANPQDPEARSQFDFLLRTLVGTQVPTQPGVAQNTLNRIVDEIGEQQRAATAENKIHQENDIRKMKGAMVLEKLLSIAPVDQKPKIEAAIGASLAPLQRRPLDAEGCRLAYQRLSTEGFYKISAPR
jgi:hypothetical protein